MVLQVLKVVKRAVNDILSHQKKQDKVKDQVNQAVNTVNQAVNQLVNIAAPLPAGIAIPMARNISVDAQTREGRHCWSNTCWFHSTTASTTTSGQHHCWRPSCSHNHCTRQPIYKLWSMMIIYVGICIHQHKLSVFVVSCVLSATAK